MAEPPTTPPTPPSPEEDSAGNAAADKLKDTYKWWDNLATINAEDPFWVGALKIGARLLGILILLALSPLILLGLMLGFIAAA